jgi:hypothetical protein
MDAKEKSIKPLSYEVIAKNLRGLVLIGPNN